MYLFHVSKINRNKDEIDMSSSIKNDIKYAYFLIDAMNRYQDFHSVFNSKIIQMYATEKDWTKEKIAVEAVFEYIRLTEYPNSPSRLLYTYFTDSLDSAKIFNHTERNGEGSIFKFDADGDKVFYYDMDIFHSAVRLLETIGLTQKTFEKLITLSRKYWLTDKDGNTEIIYKGHPVLKKTKVY